MEQNVILSVQDLDVKFTLRGQVLHAIRGVSLDVYKGESLAIVGESGSGKSVFVKTFMGLLDGNGYLDGGRILYGDRDLAQFRTEKEWLTIRGREIAMVLQDPMTSLNPLKTIGAQIREAVELHQGLHGEAAHQAVLIVEIVTEHAADLIQHADSLPDHVNADSVTRDDCNFEFHGKTSLDFRQVGCRVGNRAGQGAGGGHSRG